MPRTGRTTITVRNDRLVALIRDLPLRNKAVVAGTSQTIRDRASQMAPRDTGSLAESLYVNTSDGDSDYSQRAGSAMARNAQAVIVQEVRPEFVISLSGSTEGALMAVVGAAVSHAAPNEFGTVHMGAHPFLIPSVEGTREDFISDMSGIANA